MQSEAVFLRSRHFHSVWVTWSTHFASKVTSEQNKSNNLFFGNYHLLSNYKSCVLSSLFTPYWGQAEGQKEHRFLVGLPDIKAGSEAGFVDTILEKKWSMQLWKRCQQQNPPCSSQLAIESWVTQNALLHITMGLPLQEVVKKVSTVAEIGQENLETKFCTRACSIVSFLFGKTVLPLRINKTLLT